MNPIKKEYKISLGLTDEEIADLKKGQPVSFIFTDENFPKINVAIEHKEDDLPLTDYMNLSLDNAQQQVQYIDMNYKTEAITFRVPQNGGDQYRLYECVDQIADLIDLYFGTAIEDTTNIHRLVDEELVVAMRRQARENELENINGGSK